MKPNYVLLVSYFAALAMCLVTLADEPTEQC